MRDAPPAGPRQRLRASGGLLRRGAGGAAGLGAIGQVVNAATNVVTLYVASLLLVPPEFGDFALAFSVVSIVLGAGRGLVGATMMVDLPARGDDESRPLVASALGFTLAVGLGAAVLLAVAGLAQDVLWWFAPWVTAALLQDAGRYVFLAAGRAGRALALDLAWAFVQGAVVAGGLLVAGTVGLGLLVAAWGLGAVGGVAVLAVLHPARPASPARWTRTTRDLAGWFTAASVLGQVEVYLTLAVTGLVLSTADVGGLRAVQLLIYQPAMVLLGALLVAVQPAIVRARGSQHALRSAAARIRWATAPVVVGAVLVVLVREPLLALLFPRYTDFAPLVAPIALQVAFLALAIAPLAVLRGVRQGARVAGAQLVRAVAAGAAAGAGAVVGGPTGLAWALALASCLAWVQVQHAAHRATARAASETQKEAADDCRAA